MKIINYLIFLYYYLKGVIKFRNREYTSAKFFFDKAIQYHNDDENEFLFQYYGQTLLKLGNVSEAFNFLSKSYDIYSKKGWEAINDEEYRLVKDTLSALKYINDNFNITVNNFVFDRKIVKVKRRR